MDSTEAELRTRIAAFAEAEIAARPGLIEAKRFPRDLWRAFGAAGLTRLALPAEWGGEGGDLVTLAVAAEALAEYGGVPGVVTTWLGQSLVTRLHILGLGDEPQKARFLPALAEGRSVPCMAISEPGAGAHPKHLKTSAVLDGDDVVLNGEKAFLTNGPMADLFLVLAISDEREKRKQFSVYIVPRGTPGLEQTPGIEIDFLHPAEHCAIRLENCRVPAANRLGPEGQAFEAISLPMRRAEDALFAASTAGAMRHLLTRLEPGGTDEDDLAELGRLAAAPNALSALARRACAMVETGAAEDHPAIEAIADFARGAARDWLSRLATLRDKSAITVPAALQILLRDLEKMLSIAGSAHTIRARRRAQALFA
jgi:acyl-CoA dehydrogenase